MGRSDETRQLKKQAARLRQSLGRLLYSKRPDWGYPMLVGLARLAATDASIRSRRLVMLDVFEEDAATLPVETLRRHDRTFSLLLEEHRRAFVEARVAFLSGGDAGETEFSRFEVAGNRFAELRHARSEQSTLRVHSGALVPMRGTAAANWPTPHLSERQLRSALNTTRQQENAYAAQLRRLYPYDMLRRNCVTEIFRTIDAALAPTAAGDVDDERAQRRIRDRSARLLGGHVEMRETLNFIPFVSARTVAATYRASVPTVRPSHRKAELARMYAREPEMRVYLRESNVLTARTYERDEGDPLFLFFTEDAKLARPLFGVANLAVGIGATAAGLALLPFDAGETLRAGADGVLFSLPELVFVNLRKGSYRFAPQSWLGDDDRHDPPVHPAASAREEEASPCGIGLENAQVAGQ